MSYALITGASKGIGKEIAFELAQKKNNLLLIARSEDILINVKAEILSKYNIKIDILAIDLSKANVATEILQWVASKKYEVSMLINNAGYGLAGRFDAYPYEQTANMMQLNMQTLTELCYVFLPMLKAQKKAYILNIASSTAYQAIPNMSIYAATKVFVLYFSRGLKQELKNTNVSVTVISPGATDTNFNDAANMGEKAREQAKKVTMTPQEVAKISVNSMLAEKTEVVPGFINKLGKFLVWLAPKSLTEKVAGGIYE